MGIEPLPGPPVNSPTIAVWSTLAGGEREDVTFGNNVHNMQRHHEFICFDPDVYVLIRVRDGLNPTWEYAGLWGELTTWA